MLTNSLLERVRHYARPEGTFECRGTWLRQEGEMRFVPDGPWMSFSAQQWFPGRSVDFRWRAWVRMGPFMRACVIDAFENGTGTLSAWIFGFIPIVRSRGAATDKGEALRGLAELPWRPFAFDELSPLSWEALEEDKLRVSFNNGRTEAAVVFDVDREGRVRGGTASSRPRMVGKSFVETAWSGSFGEYRIFNGVRVPTTAEAVWHLPEGPFTCWRGHVVEFCVLR